MRFRNPANGQIDDFGDTVWPQVLVLGPIYFASKGMWSHAILAGVMAFMSAFLTWFFVYPFFAKMIIRSHYAKKGWTDISDLPKDKLRAGVRDTDIRIMTGPPPSAHRPLSEVTVKLIRFSPADRKYTQEDANLQLKEKAWLLGANAIANVRYEQCDWTMTSAGHIEASGLAIIDESAPE